MLDAEQPRSMTGESETNISDAVALGLARLRAAGARRKVLVLLTDGEHNVSTPRSGWSPRQAAQIAASLDVPIYTIDAGSDGPTAEADATASAAGPGARACRRCRTWPASPGASISPRRRHGRPARRVPGHRSRAANGHRELPVSPLS